MSRASAFLAVLLALGAAGVAWTAWSIGPRGDRGELASADEPPSDTTRSDGGEHAPAEPHESFDALELDVESSTRVPVATLGAGAAIGAPDAARPSRFLGGRVVDDATGEALAQCALEFRDAAGARANATTDGEGRFALQKELAPGALAWRAFERGREFDLATELVLGEDGEPKPVELRVALGPTYRLVVAPVAAPPIDELRARFSVRTTSGNAQTSAVLIAGEPHLVRCGAVSPDTTGEADLVVESKDGVWTGRTSVRLGRGMQAGVVRVELQPLAALEVVVDDAEGEHLAGANVQWISADGGKPRDAGTDRAGRVVFERVPPQAGTLRVRSMRHVDAEIPLVLPRGERRVEVVVMTRSASGGSIRGVVLSDSGAYDGDVRLRLVSRDGRPGRIDARVAWTTVSGVKRGTFAFDDVPLGKFRVELSEDDWYAWEPRRVDVEAPRHDLQFVVRDTVAVADVVVDPREENGAAFAGPYEVRLAGAGDTRLAQGNGGPVVVARVPVDAPLRWRVDAPDRRTVFGTWRDLVQMPSVEGRERSGASPVLERGWSQQYRVVRADNRRPVADAVALIDGREAGKTGKDGRVVLRAAEKPGKVAFRVQGWRQLDTPRLLARPGAHEQDFEVRLEPPRERKRK